MVARRRGISLSNDLEPAHGGLQKMVVILRHRLGYEHCDLVVGETSLPCSLAATGEYYKDVAVMPSKRNGYVGIFWRHCIGSSRQSTRQEAWLVRKVQSNIKVLYDVYGRHAFDRT